MERKNERKDTKRKLVFCHYLLCSVHMVSGKRRMREAKNKK